MQRHDTNPRVSGIAGAFVGRAQELAELDVLLNGLPDGRGGTALFAGEAGIGKTRLAEETAQRAAALGARVCWGACWAAGGAPIYWPWIQVLRALSRMVDATAWDTWLHAAGPPLAPLTTAFAAPAALPSDAAGARFALFDAATRLLRRAAAEHPLLIVLDDLHAADLPSLTLLEYATRELHDVPVAVLGTYRSTEVDQQPATAESIARSARHALHLPLAGLSVGEVGRIAAVSGAPLASETLVTALHATTAGNPLFVTELLRGLAAAHPDGGPAQLPLALPGSVRAVVADRLAGLSRATREILETAAVIGGEVELVTLRAARPHGDGLLEALAEGVAAAVLADVERPWSRLVFRHPLLRDVLLDSLPPAQRAALHDAVAQGLEHRYGGDAEPHLAALAHHFRAGCRNPTKALSYTIGAARRAGALGADEAAAAEYRHALALLAVQPSPDTTLLGTLLVELGDALVRGGDGAAARPIFLNAAAHARALGDAALLGRVVLSMADRGLGVPHRVADSDVLELGTEALAALPTQDSLLRSRLLNRLAAERAVADDDATMALSAEGVAMARRLAIAPRWRTR